MTRNHSSYVAFRNWEFCRSHPISSPKSPSNRAPTPPATRHRCSTRPFWDWTATRSHNSSAFKIKLKFNRFSKFLFSYDIPNNKFLVKTQMGPVYLNGLYSVSGKILSIPIQGQGEYTTNISKIFLQYLS